MNVQHRKQLLTLRPSQPTLVTNRPAGCYHHHPPSDNEVALRRAWLLVGRVTSKKQKPSTAIYY